MAQSLWDFAVGCYQRPGVAEACLALQDQAAADVNLLLAAAWLAQGGRRWSREDVGELTRLCAGWRKYCLLPLRGVRRYLKEYTDIEPLYHQAKALELEAERRQLRLIEEAIAHIKPQRQLLGRDLLSANLAACEAVLPAGAGTGAAFEQLLVVLGETDIP